MTEAHASLEGLSTTSEVVPRVEQRIGSFLHSRLPGPKTEKAMEFYDAISKHLPAYGQEAARKLRPIVKAGAYAGNCVGTYYEAMLVASLAGGVVLLGKEALKVVPETGKRKGIDGAISRLHLETVPKSFGSALRTESENIGHDPRQWLRNALRGKPSGSWREAPKQPVIEPHVAPPPPAMAEPSPLEVTTPVQPAKVDLEQVPISAIVGLNNRFDLALYNATQGYGTASEGAEALSRVLMAEALPNDLDLWDRPKTFPKDYDSENLGKLNSMLERFIEGSDPEAFLKTFGDGNIEDETIESWIQGGGSQYFTEAALKDPRIQYLKNLREVNLFIKYMKDIFKERDIENPDLGKLVATQVIKKDWRAFGRHPDYDALGDIANKTIQLVKQVFKNPLIQLLMQPKDNGGNV